MRMPCSSPSNLTQHLITAADFTASLILCSSSGLMHAVQTSEAERIGINQIAKVLPRGSDKSSDQRELRLHQVYAFHHTETNLFCNLWGKLALLCSCCAVCLSPCCGQDASQPTGFALKSHGRDAAGCVLGMLMYAHVKACIADIFCNLCNSVRFMVDLTVLLPQVSCRMITV